MNLSIKWLNEFIDTKDITAKGFADAMTMSGSKVESYSQVCDNIKNIVVCKILSIERHPDADKLFVCSVDIGQIEPIQIVTNATNININDFVPVALDKAILADGTKIKKGKLRGVVSQGMFCSYKEIGIHKELLDDVSDEGVLVVNGDYTPGQDIREALDLNDTIFEFEITPNRPDCLSILGLAREAAVTFNKTLNLHKPVVDVNNKDTSELISVDVEKPNLCPFYGARVVKNVRIKPSPRWMRERLISVGIRPINNIVDITNYLLTEYGQPMHAFDLDMIHDKKIIVRSAENGEKVKTLDDVERTLSKNDLVIADTQKVLAIAGVMGSEYSGINNNTKTIVFESANFDAKSVRLTAKNQGMRTDASSKYEKSLDPNNCIPALDRACELVNLLDAGDVVGDAVYVNNISKQDTILKLDVDWINSFLSTNISKKNMEDILKKLGCKIFNDDIIVPSFRQDLEHKADIAEEIARFYGYDKINSSSAKCSMEGKYTKKQKFQQKLNNTMIALGLSEIMTYSFISPKYYDKICMPKDHKLRNSVVLSNPLGEDTSIMRTTAIPSMLEVLSRNYNNMNEHAYLFEIGKEYIPTEENKLPIEKNKLTIGLFGKETDFLFLKGILEDMLESLDIVDYDVESNTESFVFHPGRCANIIIKNKNVGIMGEIHPFVLDNYEMDKRIYLLSIDIDDMFENVNFEKTYKSLPKHPASTRDLALICDEDITIGTIQKAILAAGGEVLESLQLFDVYKGEQIERGKKSVAFKLYLRSKDNTLTDDKINSTIDQIMKKLNNINVFLRS